jgi:hypothetical protein
MIIEGIRRQPQGSVDYVVRGGAGGRLLIAEGLEDEGAWPELGEWSPDDTRLVVSLAESLYASPHMSEIALPTKPDELREWMQEHAPHLLPALAEASDSGAGSAGEEVKRKRGSKSADNDGDADDMKEGLTEADVRRILSESSSDMPTVEEFEERLREQTQRTIAERDEQRELSTIAHRLIESAVGIPPKWKADLQTRYSMLPDGPPASLQIAESEQRDADGKELTARQVLEARVEADLDHVRDLIAEATGKPRVKGEGAKTADAGESGRRAGSQRKVATPYWRSRFVNMGLAESEDKAVEAFGGKVEG